MGKWISWAVGIVLYCAGAARTVADVTPATQTGWLLRTASELNVTEITESPTVGSKVSYFNGAGYDFSTYTQPFFGNPYWDNSSLTIPAGGQFVFEMPGGTNEYLAWPYAYVGDWDLTAPAAEAVSGDVTIAWTAAHRSDNAPDYAARVVITGAAAYEEVLGVVWETESVVWQSSAAPAGTYTIKVSFTDSTAEGGLGLEVASVSKDVVVAHETSLSASIASITQTVALGTSPAADPAFLVSGFAGSEPAVVPFTVAADAAWVSCSPASGSTGTSGADTVTVRLSTASLAAGAYSAEITVSAADAGIAPVVIPVSVTVEDGAALEVDTSEIKELIIRGGTPDRAWFNLSAATNMDYTVSDDAAWMTCSPSAGALDEWGQRVYIEYSTEYLPAGSYTGTVTVASTEASNSPQTVRVVVEVANSVTTVENSGWLSRSAETAYIADIDANGDAPGGSMVHLFGSGVYTTASKGLFGWMPNLEIPAGAQFVFESPDGGHECTNWPHAHVGDWQMTAPADAILSGEVKVAWEASDATEVVGAARPDYAATVTVSGVDESYSQTFGAVFNDGSVTWDATDVPTGNYVISLSLADSPAEGTVAREVATITRQVYVESSGNMGGDDAEILLSRDTISVSFEGYALPFPEYFDVWNPGSNDMNYVITDDADWISCSPASGSSARGRRDTITVDVDPSGFPAGEYTAEITISSADAVESPKTIAFVMAIGTELGGGGSGDDAHLTVSCDEIEFGGTAAGGRSFSLFHVGNSGGSELGYAISDDAAWLSCSPASGALATNESERITVACDPAGLVPGTYSAEISVASQEADNAPQTISVTLDVWLPANVWLLKAGNDLESAGMMDLADESVISIYNNGVYAAHTYYAGITWHPEFSLRAGDQVVYHGDGLAWDGEFCGDWALSAPADGSAVSGALRIAWAAGSASENPPDYAAVVTVAGGAGYTNTFAAVVGDGSVTWDSSAAPDGEYDVGLSIHHVPSPGVVAGAIWWDSTSVVVDNDSLTLAASVSDITRNVAAGTSPGATAFEVVGYDGAVYADVDFAVSDDAGWMTCSPAAGSTGEGGTAVAVSFSTEGLAVGSHTGAVSVASAEAVNSPQTIQVVVHVVEGTPAEQTGWLLRAAAGVSVTEVTDSPFGGDKVYAHDGSEYAEAEFITYFNPIAGLLEYWNPDTLSIAAGQPFVYESQGGTDAYLSWPYAFVGNWCLSSPLDEPVAGEVEIAWRALERSGRPGNPAPDYHARVSIESGYGAVETFEAVRGDGSLSWDSRAFSDGEHTITIDILDAPYPEVEGMTVATITKTCTTLNGHDHPIEGGVDMWVDGFAWRIAPDALEIGAASTGNTLTITNGGVEATSVTIHEGSALQLLEGGELIVAGDFDAGQGGFDFAGGTLAVGGSLSGISSLPPENRLEALEIAGDLTVYGVFSPARAETVAPAAGIAAAAGTGATIDGALTLEPGGALEIEIGGTDLGTESDHLTVTGAATLGGELNIVLTDGFAPAVGSSFELLDFIGGASGAFTSVNLRGPLGLALNTDALYSNGTIRFALSAEDSDLDGMVDGWEYAYFGGDVAPTNNADRDGCAALAEYIAGTDPTNAASFFHVDAARKLPEGFVVEWAPSIDARVYSISWSTNLAGGFLPLEGAFAFPENCHTDTTHSAESAVFYRVEARLEE